MDMRIDQARQNDATSKIDAVGLRSCESAHFGIAPHGDDAVTADRERLRDAAVRILSVNPTVKQDEIGGRLC